MSVVLERVSDLRAKTLRKSMRVSMNREARTQSRWLSCFCFPSFGGGPKKDQVHKFKLDEFFEKFENTYKNED